MNTSSNDNHIICNCANCGKGEEDNVALKNCVACKMVKYCSRDCQKAHRPQHKKECRKRAAELHDEALFKQPPPQFEDCPICFLQLPSLHSGYRYVSCCGKLVCGGCFYAGANMDGNVDELCPFCRTPAPFSEEEIMKRVKKRVEVGDAQAIYSLACDYKEGMYGMPQDRNKALELWHRAGELGSAKAYCNIGFACFTGEGVERDDQKAKHYFELAAMGGDHEARHNLGCVDFHAGNDDRAFKHFMIAVGSGYHGSLKMVQQMCKDGHASTDDYAKALKAYQEYLVEIKSNGRDKAAASSDRFKYYE